MEEVNLSTNEGDPRDIVRELEAELASLDRRRFYILLELGKVARGQLSLEEPHD